MTAMHLEERLITQLVSLAPHLDGDHVDEIARPALFEVALTIADLLRPAENEDRIAIFSGTQRAPCSGSYEMCLRLDAEQEYERKTRRCQHHVHVSRNKPYTYLITDGSGPTAWEGGLCGWRAIRIWVGLADLIEARFRDKTYTFDDGTDDETVKPAIGPEFLAKLREVRAQIHSKIVVAEAARRDGSSAQALEPTLRTRG